MLYGKTESRMPSRFIDEIPFGLIDKIAERGGRLHSSPFANSGKSERTFGTKESLDSVLSTFNIGTAASKILEKLPCDFKKGDRVMHKKFGPGMICDITDTGDDTELEISFDRVGSRRLLASFAKLEKIK